MRVDIIAVGRIKPGPEKELFDLYAERFDAQGRGQSLITVMDKGLRPFPMLRKRANLRESSKLGEIN